MKNVEWKESIADGDACLIDAMVIAAGVSLASAGFYGVIPEDRWTRTAPAAIATESPDVLTRHPIAAFDSLKSPHMATLSPAFVSADDEARWSDYEAAARNSPDLAVAMILCDVRSGLVPTEDATDWLFANLAASRLREESPFYSGLLDLQAPEVLASVASRQYREQGNEKRLSLLASLLSDLGTLAWPTIESIVTGGGPECEYIVPLIATLPMVQNQARVSALSVLAKSSDPDVIWGVLNVLDYHPELRTRQIVEALVASEDSRVSEAAKELQIVAA